MTAAEIVQRVHAAGADLRLGGPTGIELVRYRSVDAETIEAIRGHCDEVHAFLSGRALAKAGDIVRAAMLLRACRWDPLLPPCTFHVGGAPGLQTLRRSPRRTLPTADVRKRNPSARFSKKALSAAGPPPPRTQVTFNLERQLALDKALADGKVPGCDDCSSPMVLRLRRRDGEPFWGCGRYPRCKGTTSWKMWSAQLAKKASAETLAGQRAKAARKRSSSELGAD